ncbi:cell wall-binding repeat-containing protein [Agrococcus sp. TF02-05]|uniref:cell wall-binding repeat-containing protein n=1 Tax=Agrococcus sp. TF02-05 TaxID=2815211 RepID=UPI001AA0D81D|nr:cell wall-binding repeat-containing protein [Agrococcus sp. TF02-05]MBO1769477.1 cell wall-binding repeat-containing protein [Agrococcus sp. TF02-05]
MASKRRVAAFFIAAVTAGSGSALAPTDLAVATTADVTAPVVSEIAVSPGTVDVSSADAEVVVSVRITDDLAGAIATNLWLSHDGSAQRTEGTLALVSGTALDGRYEATLRIQHGAAPGAWSVGFGMVQDAAGNVLDDPFLGRHTSVTVVNSGPVDLTPPRLLAYEVSPPAVDVLVAGQEVTIRARIVDDLAGVLPPLVDAFNDAGSFFAGEMALVSGTVLDGWYETRVTVPRGTLAGDLRFVPYSLEDARGNGVGFDRNAFPHSVSVTYGTSEDVSAPQVVSFAADPVGNDPYLGSALVTLRAHIIDAGAGVVPPIVRINWSEVPLTLASGDEHDGIWEATAHVAPLPETQVATLAWLRDFAGNVTADGPSLHTTFTADQGPVAGIPEAPTDVIAVPGNGEATVSWTAPASNGGAAITSYIITAAPGDATATVPASQTTATLKNLTNGTAYRFTVVAVNSAGSSRASAASPAVTPRTVPGTPTGVAASPGFGEATVTWVAPASNGGAAIDSYTITTIPGGATVTVPALQTTATVGGLSTGTPYRFTVTAHNAAGSSPASQPSPAIVPLAPTRLAGDSRYSTAAAIADRFPAGVDTVYIASGLNFPDALTGAALAGSQVSPVLLTREREVPQATIDALVRLKPRSIVILGGPATVSNDVQSALQPYGQVSRIAGSDRYDNAAAVSAAFAPGIETVYVASGTNFPDALAGAGLAGSTGSPVLLTRQQSLPESIRAAIQRLQPERIVILGGPASVSEQVRGELARIATTTRISGSDRYEVAAQISAQFGEVDHVYVASGQVFPDALAGAALAGAQGAPVLLVRSNEVPGATLAAIERLAPERITVLGGETTIGPEVEEQLRSLVR